MSGPALTQHSDPCMYLILQPAMLVCCVQSCVWLGLVGCLHHNHLCICLHVGQSQIMRHLLLSPCVGPPAAFVGSWGAHHCVFHATGVGAVCTQGLASAAVCVLQRAREPRVCKAHCVPLHLCCKYVLLVCSVASEENLCHACALLRPWRRAKHMPVPDNGIAKRKARYDGIGVRGVGSAFGGHLHRLRLRGVCRNSTTPRPVYSTTVQSHSGFGVVAWGRKENLPWHPQASCLSVSTCAQAMHGCALLICVLLLHA